MRIRISCSIVSLLLFQFVLGQTIYTWNGSSTTWSNALAFTPQRINPMVTDIIIFPAGNFTVTQLPAAEHIQRLVFQENAIVAFQTNQSYTLQLGTTGNSLPALSVAASAKWTLSGLIPLPDPVPTAIIQLVSANDGIVLGEIQLQKGAHQLVSAKTGGIQFETGSRFTAAVGFSGNAFGTVAPFNAVIFKNGSSYYFEDGSNPFGATVPNAVAVFEEGSTFYHATNAFASTSGRTYGNYTVLNNTSWTQLGQDMQIKGSLTIRNCNLTFNPSAAQSGKLHLYGDLRLEGSANFNFGNANPNYTGAFVLKGLLQQIGSGGGSGQIQITNLQLNTNSNAYLQRDITVMHSLQLQLGVLHTGSYQINLPSTTSLSSLPHSYLGIPNQSIGHQGSYIDGKINYTQVLPGANLVFPVGHAGYFRPFFAQGITSAGTVAGQYRKANPQVAFGTAKATALQKISEVEYWELNSTATVQQVLLSFMDPASGGVYDLSQLAVAQWEGMIWSDGGNLQSNGVANQSGLLFSQFRSTGFNGPLTLASYHLVNVLPIPCLTTFNVVAQVKSNSINSIWQSDCNGSNIRLLKGGHPQQLFPLWEGIASTATPHSIMDYLPANLTYYQWLAKLPNSSNWEYGDIVACQRNDKVKTSVFPNPANTFVSIALTKQPVVAVQISLINANGQVVQRWTQTQLQAKQALQNHPAGIYQLHLQEKNKTEMIRLLIMH